MIARIVFILLAWWLFFSGSVCAGNVITIFSSQSISITLTPVPTSWNPVCTEGGADATQNITFTANNGSVTLGAVAAALTTGTVFSITGDTCSSTTVTIGNTCVVSLAMDCIVAGSPTDTLTVTSDATDSPKYVLLSGTINTASEYVIINGIPTLINPAGSVVINNGIPVTM